MAKKILVVEDTKNIREIVAFMLRNRGHEVMEAPDGEVGWKKATTENPDLIVLDAMLPGRTGFDICADLKASPKYQSIPVIILTAITQNTGKDDKYWKEKSMADDFMSKPFKPQELMERVEKLLGIAPKSEG